MSFPSDLVEIKTPAPKPEKYLNEKGGEISVKAILALANLAFLVWLVYFLYCVANYVNAWPFN